MILVVGLILVLSSCAQDADPHEVRLEPLPTFVASLASVDDPDSVGGSHACGPLPDSASIT